MCPSFLSIDFSSSDKDPGAQLFIPQQMHNKPPFFTQQLIKTGIDTAGKYPLGISLIFHVFLNLNTWCFFLNDPRSNKELVLAAGTWVRPPPEKCSL